MLLLLTLPWITGISQSFSDLCCQWLRFNMTTRDTPRVSTKQALHVIRFLSFQRSCLSVFLAERRHLEGQVYIKAIFRLACPAALRRREDGPGDPELPHFAWTSAVTIYHVVENAMNQSVRLNFISRSHLGHSVFQISDTSRAMYASGSCQSSYPTGHRPDAGCLNETSEYDISCSSQSNAALLATTSSALSMEMFTMLLFVTRI